MVTVITVDHTGVYASAGLYHADGKAIVTHGNAHDTHTLKVLKVASAFGTLKVNQNGHVYSQTIQFGNDETVSGIVTTIEVEHPGVYASAGVYSMTNNKAIVTQGDAHDRHVLKVLKNGDEVKIVVNQNGFKYEEVVNVGLKAVAMATSINEEVEVGNIVIDDIVTNVSINHDGFYAPVKIVYNGKTVVSKGNAHNTHNLVILKNGEEFELVITVNGRSYTYTARADRNEIQLGETKLNVITEGIYSKINVYNEEGDRVAFKGSSNASGSFTLDPGYYDVVIYQGTATKTYNNLLVMGSVLNLDDNVATIMVDHTGVYAKANIQTADGDVNYYGSRSNGGSIKVLKNADQPYEITITQGPITWSADIDSVDQTIEGIVKEIKVDHTGVYAKSNLYFGDEQVTHYGSRNNGGSLKVIDTENTYLLKVSQGLLVAEREISDEIGTVTDLVKTITINHPGVYAKANLYLDEEQVIYYGNRNNGGTLKVLDTDETFKLTVTQGPLTYTIDELQLEDEGITIVEGMVRQITVDHPGVYAKANLYLDDEQVIYYGNRNNGGILKVLDTDETFKLVITQGPLTYTIDELVLEGEGITTVDEMVKDIEVDHTGVYAKANLYLGDEQVVYYGNRNNGGTLKVLDTDQAFKLVVTQGPISYTVDELFLDENITTVENIVTSIHVLHAGDYGKSKLTVDGEQITYYGNRNNGGTLKALKGTGGYYDVEFTTGGMTAIKMVSATADESTVSFEDVFFNETFDTSFDAFLPYNSNLMIKDGYLIVDDQTPYTDENNYSGVFTRLGGYTKTWNGNYTVETVIYLNPTAMVAGQGFEFSVAANRPSGSHFQDYIFHVAKDTSTGELLVSASQNAAFETIENLETRDDVAKLTEAGNYTFQQRMFDVEGELVVHQVVLNEANEVVFSRAAQVHAEKDLQDDVAGNRYWWVTYTNLPDGLMIDSVKAYMSETEATDLPEYEKYEAPTATLASRTSIENRVVAQANIVEEAVELETTGAYNTYTLDVSFEGILEDNLVWLSGDESIVTVENGILSATGAGITTVYVSDTNGTVLDQVSVEVFLVDEEETPLGAVVVNTPYMVGFEDGTFRPENGITRAQLAVIYSKILNLNTELPIAQQYTDVDASHWAYKYIQATSITGIFSGYSDGSFRPNKEATIGELATTISKYWAYLGIEVSEDAINGLLTDEHWSDKYIYKLFHAHLLSLSEVDPNALATRAQIVEMFNRLIGKVALDVEVSSFSDVTGDLIGQVEAATN